MPFNMPDEFVQGLLKSSESWMRAITGVPVAGEAPTTLNEYCQQADKQVLFDYQELRHRRTRSVVGMLTPSEALKVLLQGTDLVAESVNEQTLAVTTR